MLRIRPDQRQRFEAIAIDQFVEEATYALRKAAPDLVDGLEDEVLGQQLRDAREAAEPYEIVGQRDIVRFWTRRRVHGPDFDQRPPFTEILRDDDFDGTEKLDRINAIDSLDFDF